LIQSGYIESCLTAQKRFMQFKGQGSFQFFLNLRKCRLLKAYRLIPLTLPLPGHFTVPLTLRTYKRPMGRPNLYRVRERGVRGLR
jgi:hypothetical protein